MITRMEVQKKWGKFRIYAIKGGGRFCLLLLINGIKLFGPNNRCCWYKNNVLSPF